MSWLVGLILVFGVSTTANAALLIEDGGANIQESLQNDRESFRHQRKLGVGLEAAGSLGLAGAKLEVGLTPRYGFGLGFGLGPGYQSFNLFVKNTLGGNVLSPYATLGFSKWYSVGAKTNINESAPSFLAQRFLDDEERRTGKYAESLLYPALGVQYNQLSGGWTGVAAYLELLLLVDIEDFVSAVTGGLGLLYYF